MKIGATLSPNNKEIIARIDLDFIEVKNLEVEFLNANSNILKKYPCKSMHVQYLPSSSERRTTLNLASDRVFEVLEDEQSDLYKAYQLLEPSIISFHLGFSSEEVGTCGIDNHNYAIGDVLTREEVFKRLTNSLSLMNNRFRSLGFEGPMLIENLDYNDTGAYEYICEPAFITSIVRKLDYSILLDIGHLIISSNKLGINISEYLSELHMDRIKEIHINAPLYEQNNWYDINKPFYNDIQADELVRFIISESVKKNHSLFLNIECDDEIEKQTELLHSLLLLLKRKS